MRSYFVTFFVVLGVFFTSTLAVSAQNIPSDNRMYCLGSCPTKQPASPTTTTSKPTSIVNHTIQMNQTSQSAQKGATKANPSQQKSAISKHKNKQTGFLSRLIKLLFELFNLLFKSNGQPSVTPDPQPTNQPSTTIPHTTVEPTATAMPTNNPSKNAVNGSAGCGLPITPGKTNETLTVNGVKRTYVLVVPTGLDPNTPVPIIMGFHGGSDTGEHASQYMGLTGTEPALYVYPQAPYWAEAGGVGWNVDPAGVDFPYFDALLLELGKKHCADMTNVFVAGKSNGAFFVNALACHRPNAIRAIASVAGGGTDSRCTKSMDAMIIHGSADAAVPFSQGTTSRDIFRQINKCSGTTTPVSPSPCVSYSGCTKSVVWCQHSGGHDWPTWAGAGIRKFFLSL